MLFVKFIVIMLLGFIVVSLFSGLFFLVKDKGQTHRTVNALTFRIGLSILAVVVVLIAAAAGVIELNPSPVGTFEGNLSADTPPPPGAETTDPGARRRIDITDQ